MPVGASGHHRRALGVGRGGIHPFHSVPVANPQATPTATRGCRWGRRRGGRRMAGLVGRCAGSRRRRSVRRLCSESADRAGVSTTEGCRRLDFDRGNEAVCGFQYEVYFGAVSIAVVEQSRCLLRPSELSPEFCDHESFDDGSGRVGVGMWTGSGRRDIDEASGQSGVEKEDFRSIDDPLGKVGRPRGYAVDEIQGLEEVEVRRQGTYGDFGVGS